jgi:hypothetical protein
VNKHAPLRIAPEGNEAPTTSLPSETPELWFEDVENKPDVSRGRPSWFLDRDDKPTLLDEELVEALRDETARAVLREVIRLPEQERRVVLSIVRHFADQ